MFKGSKNLTRIIKGKNIKTYVIGITEEEKQNAVQNGKVGELKEKISRKLDGMGYSKREGSDIFDKFK